jgi:hypothetical protein
VAGCLDGSGLFGVLSAKSGIHLILLDSRRRVAELIKILFLSVSLGTKGAFAISNTPVLGRF